MDINRLRKLIQIKKITQKEVAKYIGLSENAFSTALKKGDFKISMLEKIAEFFDVPVSYFFEEEGSMNIGSNINNGIIQAKNGNIQIQLDRKDSEIEKLRQEVDYLKKLLKEKDEIINLLKNK